MVSRFLIHNFALKKVAQIVLYWQKSKQVSNLRLAYKYCFVNFKLGSRYTVQEMNSYIFIDKPMHALIIKKRVFTTAKLILIPRTTPLTELVTHHASFTVKRRDNAWFAVDKLESRHGCNLVSAK